MRSKTLVITAAAVTLFALAAFGIARAQQTAPKPAPTPSTTCPCMQPGTGMMGQSPMMRMGAGGMGNMGMMQGMRMQPGAMSVRGGMMGSCPMMVSGANVEVKSIANGAVITVTSTNPKTARRIQIMAEMMKLRQELRSLQ